MRVLVWVVEGTWEACVAAAAEYAATGAVVTLLYVTPDDLPEAAHSAFAGLLGRGPGRSDPGEVVRRLADESATALLDAAAERLGRPAEREVRTGRVEREVVAAAAAADLLVLARDGDRSRLGPPSLGRHTRFAVDHAPCAVLLVWPDPAPGLDSIPPPPQHPPGHHPPDHPSPPHPHPPH